MVEMDGIITISKWVVCGMAALFIAELAVPILCDIIADLAEYIKKTTHRTEE